MSAGREKIAKRRQRKRRRRLKSSFKIFLFFFLLVISAAAYTGIRYFHALHAPDPYGKLEDIRNTQPNTYDLSEEVMPEAKYWILDVGKGESIYIKCGQTDILIDAGYEESGEKIIKAIKGELTGDLDYLIITSTSDRRTGGIKAICNEFDPAKVITCTLGNKAIEIKRAVGDRAIEEGFTTTISLTENGSLSIFRPEVSSKDPYDRSLLTLFRYGSTSFFAESDAGEEEEARVIEQLNSCNVLVLARAGSDQVNQHVGDIACSTYIVSCAEGEGPSDALVESLKGSIYATYNSGTVKFTTNGKDLDTNLEREKTE